MSLLQFPTIKLVVSSIRVGDKFKNARLHDDSDNTLDRSIRGGSMFSYPVVQKAKDGAFDLVAGFGRHASMLKLAKGDAAMDALYIDATGADARQINLMENVARTQLHWSDVVFGVADYCLRHKDLDRDGQAKMLGISRSAVASYMTIYESPYWPMIRNRREAGLKLPTLEDMRKIASDKKLPLPIFEAFCETGDMPEGGGSSEGGEGSGEGEETEQKTAKKALPAAKIHDMLKLANRAYKASQGDYERGVVAALKWVAKKTQNAPIEEEEEAAPKPRAKKTAE